ncbi:MAG TPA: aspartate carbamoyltransferase regulatory subunit [Halobacteria archaeon]|jgi:aspartate carbamoyltransferase regulatory subunit|nr:aspartate carbamoyltransferase regulatory subunit [Halobacteria archaeon]HIH78341.1 aspartate carbamoyltransferase regulatory subunit [Halobacteria archaeon]
MLRIESIKDGTVIDHITAGQALNVLKILHITPSSKETVSMAMNVSSKKIKRKDIVKIENRMLKKEELNKIALIATNATINIIKDYKVVEKYNVKVPEIVKGIIKCRNRNCITNLEEIDTKFKLESKDPLILKCAYCEMKTDTIEFL